MLGLFKAHATGDSLSKRRNPTLELLRQTNRFVDDLEEALALKVDLRGGFDGVLLCGMGGSAISGDIVADLCSDVSPVPVGVLRYPALPRWVSERALVVVASYSGNTRETKRMYEEAAGAGCTVAVICSGGDIEKVARERGTCSSRSPRGYSRGSPRAS